MLEDLQRVVDHEPVANDEDLKEDDITFYSRHYASYQNEKRASDAILLKLQKKRRSFKKSDSGDDAEMPLSPASVRLPDEVSDISGALSPGPFQNAVPLPTIPANLPCVPHFNYDSITLSKTALRRKLAHAADSVAPLFVWKRPTELIRLCSMPRAWIVSKQSLHRAPNAELPSPSIDMSSNDSIGMEAATSSDEVVGPSVNAGLLQMKKLLLQKRLEQLKRQKAASSAVANPPVL